MIIGTGLKVSTRIKTTRKWDKDIIVTGNITYPFGCFGGRDLGAIAGIYIDRQFKDTFPTLIGNLFKGDFEEI